MILLRLLKESLFFAISALILNKLRTFLSLLGITIGIFAIISVFTVLDSLENSIKTSIGKLGDNVVYIQKWPWIMGEGDYPWWKYMNRPNATLKEKKILEKKLNNAEAVVFNLTSRVNVNYKDVSIDNITLIGATYNYDKVRNFELSGRYFTSYESKIGSNKTIIGSKIAQELFDNTNPIGKYIKVKGYKLFVTGIFNKEGNDMFGQSIDNSILIPINFIRNIYDIKSERLNPQIMIKSKPNISVDVLIDELQGTMRTIRKLKPKEEDNFALNRSSMITKGFESIFGMVDLIGLIIGGFSILVGGFGIANIMFVSVKERTKIIGIQKSLGAKNFFILFQFLSESVILSLVGGIIGLILIWLGTILANNLVDSMNFNLSFGNILTGILISIAIGIISGFAPAKSASSLNPVEAMNTSF
jgi:putative ABC transport system permease protein